MSEDMETTIARTVDSLRARVETVHERVDCPRCGAPAGEVCRNMTRSYKRGRPLKSAHAARLRADGIPER